MNQRRKHWYRSGQTVRTPCGPALVIAHIWKRVEVEYPNGRRITHPVEDLSLEGGTQ